MNLKCRWGGYFRHGRAKARSGSSALDVRASSRPSTFFGCEEGVDYPRHRREAKLRRLAWACADATVSMSAVAQALRSALPFGHVIGDHARGFVGDLTELAVA